MKAENCIRKRVRIDGNNTYIIVGTEFVHVTSGFENRPDAERPVSREGAEMINDTITEILGLLDA